VPIQSQQHKDVASVDMAELPRLVLMGTGTFARPTFEAILDVPNVQVVGLVTQPDRDAGHRTGSTRQIGPSLKDLAVGRGIPVYQPESVNTPEGVEQLQAWRPDLLVVAAFGQILKKEVLEAAHWGGINVHASLLPKYRGAAPIAHAILNGETTTGVTIIRMTTGLDAGDMLAQEVLAIGPDETAGELEVRLAPIGANLALQVVENALRSGGISPLAGVKQDTAQVTKAPKLKKENGLIDWSQPAERVARQVRAMQPWPTAFTFLHRGTELPQRLIIHRVRAGFSLEETPAEYWSAYRRFFAEALREAGPSCVVLNPYWANRIFVSVVSDAVEILSLQPAGKKPMTTAEFLRGHPLHAGDRFGPELE
jgi:methionyl-tRNA formyltransferase